MSTSTKSMNYYKITEIEFDFDYEDLAEYEKEEIINSTKSCLWNPPSEEDLVDCISDNTGWCIKSLKYDVIN